MTNEVRIIPLKNGSGYGYYGWLRTDDMLIYRSKGEAEERSCVLNPTARTVAWMYAVDEEYELTKEARRAIWVAHQYYRATGKRISE